MNSPDNDFGGARDQDRTQAPAYGKLGPGADVTLAGPDAPNTSSQPSTSRVRVAALIAVGVGFAAAIATMQLTNSTRYHEPGDFSRSASKPVTSKDLRRIDSLSQQKQAETLLESAITNSAGAVEQISNRADAWRGHIHWNAKIANLTAAALNSEDMRVREAGIEVELAAYGVSKDSSSADSMVQEAQAAPHAQKIWALWTLGLLGNRGIEPDRVVETLIGHMKDTDDDSRRWAVESLALVGTNSTIAPLLAAMHDDPSPRVRERAACSLAVSGMLTHEQRMTAVPQLINYSDDASLDAQTHGWAFQALKDITHQRLPNESATWRNWYQSASGGN